MMARPKIRPYWRLQVFEIKGDEPRLGPDAIFQRFEDQAKETGFTDYPNPRKISDYISEWRRMTDAERAPFLQFHWPETMQHELLPWEASAAALELWVWWQDRGKPGRPTNGLARWFWRVSMIASDVDPEERFRIAETLRQVEAMRDASTSPLAAFEVRSIELWLAYHPWRQPDDQENRAKYEAALARQDLEDIAKIPEMATLLRLFSPPKKAKKGEPNK